MARKGCIISCYFPSLPAVCPKIELMYVTRLSPVTRVEEVKQRIREINESSNCYAHPDQNIAQYTGICRRARLSVIVGGQHQRFQPFVQPIAECLATASPKVAKFQVASKVQHQGYYSNHHPKKTLFFFTLLSDVLRQFPRCCELSSFTNLLFSSFRLQLRL
jgi:hypothetical protein